MKFSKSWLPSLLAALCIAAFVSLHSFVNRDLVFAMLDVGQGDALYIRSPEGKQVLIDASGGPQILEALGDVMPFFDRTIDLLIITHPDLDHFGGAQDVLSHYKVGAVAISGVANEDPAYLAMIENIRAQNIPLIFPDHTHDFQLGNAVFLDVLYPFATQSMFGQNVKNKNSTSIVMRLMRGDEPLVMLTGDMEKDQEELLLKSGQDLRANILKVGHHGANTSSSPEFLKAVDAKMALISAGRDNKYGHPHPEVLERLKGMEVRSTIESGTIAPNL